MQLPDEAQRQRAQDPNHSFIVQAPAGSGKTHLLTLRVLKLLAHVEIPEHILALTFTRRAASEMRQRILQALHHGTGTKPKQAHLVTTWQLAQAVLKHSASQGWNLLANPNRLRIMTIDSLAAACCKQLPTKTHIVASAQISEAPGILYQQAATALLSQCHITIEDQPHLYRLLQYYDNQPERVLRLLCDLLPRRDQWLHLILQSTPRVALETSLQQIAAAKLKNLASIWQRAQIDNPTLCTSHLQELLTYAAGELPEGSAHTALSLIKKYPPGTLDLEYENLTTEHLSLWQAICRILLTDQATVRKQITKQHGFPSSATCKDKAEKAHRKQQKTMMQELLQELSQHSDLINALIELQHCPPIKYADSQWQLLESLCYLLPRAVAHLQIIFQQHNMVDFVEINLQAQQALGQEDNPTDLALQLDYKLQHILVDEFQDTAYLHYNFLKQLVYGWQPGDGRSLFIVGDPMQSIYRFRDAEVSLFTQTQLYGLGAITLENLSLSCNFRSSAPLLSWINRACQQFFPTENDIARAAICYTPAQSTDPLASEALQQPIWIKAYGHDKHNAKLDEAQQIAQQIKQIQLQATKKESAPAQPSIAILARSRHHLPIIFQTLRQHDIVFQAVDIESLAQHPAILDLITLTRALMHPADEVAWYGLLRTPWCGLNLHSIYQLNQAQSKHQARYLSEFLQANHDYSHIIKDPQQLIRLQRNRKIILETLHHLGEYTCISHCIKQCWVHCGGPAALDSKSELGFCDAFFDLLNKMHDGSGHIDTGQLIQRLARAFMYSSSTTQQAAPAVQVMTIHKSKGLEFDHVFIPSLQASARPLDLPMLQWLQQPGADYAEQLIMAPLGASHDKQPEPIYQFIQNLNKQKHHLENARLLYVALTRAKRQLYLCYYQVLDCNLESETQSIEPPSPKLSTHSLLHFLQKCIPNSKTIRTDLAIKTNIQAAPTLPLSRLSAQWQCTATEHGVRSITQDPTPDELNHPNIMSLAQIQGTLIHAAMEHLTQIPPPQWARWIKQQHRYWAQQLCGFANITCCKQSLDLIESTLLALQHCPFACWALNNKQHINAYSERSYTDYTQSPARHFIMDRTVLTQSNWIGATNLPCSQWIIDYKCTLPEGLQLDMLSIENPSAHPYTNENQILNKNRIQVYTTARTQALMTQDNIEAFAQQQLEQHRIQLKTYAKLMHTMQPGTPLHMALYFPLLHLVCWQEHNPKKFPETASDKACAL